MPAESIIKRRLKSLRQREADKKQRAAEKAAGIAARAVANGIDVELQGLVDRLNTFALHSRPMPMSFYYGAGSAEGRDEAFEARRSAFYGMMAKVHSFTGWSLELYRKEIFLAAQLAGGRDGHGLKLLPIDQSQAAILNTNAAPLEYLVSQNWLETKKDPAGYGILRWATAIRFRDTVAGAQSGGLKGQTYEGGGGGFGSRLVPDYAIDCMWRVKDVQQRLHPGLFRLLRMIVVDDIWLWEIDVKRIDKRIMRNGTPAKRRDRQKFEKMRARLLKKRRDRIILKLHKAIDGAAVVFDYMSEDEYRARWLRPRRAR